LLGLPLTPEIKNAFANPENAQAVEHDTQNVEVAQKY
jgi:hypothetical protein